MRTQINMTTIYFTFFFSFQKKKAINFPPWYYIFVFILHSTQRKYVNGAWKSPADTRINCFIKKRVVEVGRVRVRARKRAREKEAKHTTNCMLQKVCSFQFVGTFFRLNFAIRATHKGNRSHEIRNLLQREEKKNRVCAYRNTTVTTKQS